MWSIKKFNLRKESKDRRENNNNNYYYKTVLKINQIETHSVTTRNLIQEYT